MSRAPRDAPCGRLARLTQEIEGVVGEGIEKKSEDLAKAADVVKAVRPYIRKFHGRTIVIKYGGNAMTDPALQQDFAEDVVLLKLVGMNPVVVHGGGPQIDEALAKIGKKGTFIQGMRVTDEETMEVVEWVLAGQVQIRAENGTDPAPVTLRGRACDEAHAVTRVRVGAQEVPVSGPGPCHPFELALPARWGLTVVDGEVENDAGQRGALSQAFLRSPSWFPAADGPGSMAESGAVVQIGPGLLDDGDRSTPDDLATLLERALQALDLDAAAGPLRFAQPDLHGDGRLDARSYDCLLYTVRNRETGFEAWKSGPLTRAGIAVERLALVDGGLAARLVVRGLRVPFSVISGLMITSYILFI